VTSVDGTGWFRGDRWMIDTLETYFRAQLGEVEIPQILKLGQHPDQLDLFSPPGVDLKTAYYHAWQMHPQRPNQWDCSLPKTITQEHILKAMQNWTGTPPGHRPHKWVVLHEGLPYPPKLLVSRAAFYAIGQYWQPHLFSGGRDLHGFLRSRFKGIEIVPIESLEATSQSAWTLQQMQIQAYH
jgi:hypothetical protein